MINKDVSWTLAAGDNVNDKLALIDTIDGADVVVNLPFDQTQATVYADVDIDLNVNVINGGSLTVRADGAQSNPFAITIAVTVDGMTVTNASLSTAYHGLAIATGDFKNFRVTVVDDTTDTIGVAVCDDAGITTSDGGATWDFTFNGAGGTPLASAPSAAAAIVINGTILTSSAASYVFKCNHGQNVMLQDLMFTNSSARGVGIFGSESKCYFNRCNSSGNAGRGCFIGSYGHLYSTTASYPVHFCGNGDQGVTNFGGSVKITHSRATRADTAYIAGNVNNNVYGGTFDSISSHFYLTGCIFGYSATAAPSGLYSIKINANTRGEVYNCFFSWTGTSPADDGMVTVYARNSSAVKVDASNTTTGGAAIILDNDTDDTKSGGYLLT